MESPTPKPDIKPGALEAAFRSMPTGLRRLWRKPIVRAWALGVMLTLLAVTLDAAGKLSPIEGWLYDLRIRRFQFFTPPPPDRLVHLDIDDGALETIGRWPWPRTTLAEIVDELRLSGADALATDILLADPQPSGIIQRSDGGYEPIDHDANLAAALSRFGKVMIPVTFTFDPRPPPSRLYAALVSALRGDLELSSEEANQRTTTSAPAAVGAEISEDEFLAARRDAMSERLRRELEHGARSQEELCNLLLPDAERRLPGSSLLHEFEILYQRTAASMEAVRFSLGPHLPVSGAGATFLPASDMTPMILPFARAAAATGYVDYPRSEEAVIRSIPLCVEYHGQVYLQMDLALACLTLGVNPHDIQLQTSEMILPRKNAASIVIPIHQVASQLYGRIGAFFDIPWFGTGDWRTLYDFPRYQQIKRHIPMTLPWALAEARKLIAHRNAEAEKAMHPLADAGVDSAKSFLQKPPDPNDLDAGFPGMEAVIREASELAGPALNSQATELHGDDLIFFNAFNAIRRVLNDNRADLRTLEKKSAELRGMVAGKAILIGGTATATGDQWPTPLHSAWPGVCIHGVIFNSIVGGYFWRVAPAWVNLLATVLAGVLTTLIVAHCSPHKALLATILLAGLCFILNALVFFDYGKTIVGLAGPLMAIAMVWSMVTLTRLISESRERARITRRFRSYVDPSLVKYVIEHPELAKLEGEVREMTVVFTDLAGFTSFAEQLREKAVKILGRYMARMVPPIRRNNGFVHRFMGDGIMFSYGAPEPNAAMAADAVSTVLEMHEALNGLNEELIAEGYPRLVMRAGLNTGMAVVGDSGSDVHEAVEYACLGHTTNMAARLEGANSAMGTNSLIAERTREMLGDRFLVRPIARLVLVGATEAVMTYEPMARAESATEAQRQMAALTASMFDAFVAGQFQECITAADRLDQAAGVSKLTTLYRELCQAYLTQPPPEWQGNITLRGK